MSLNTRSRVQFPPFQFDLKSPKTDFIPSDPRRCPPPSRSSSSSAVPKLRRHVSLSLLTAFSLRPSEASPSSAAPPPFSVSFSLYPSLSLSHTFIALSLPFTALSPPVLTSLSPHLQVTRVPPPSSAVPPTTPKSAIPPTTSKSSGHNIYRYVYIYIYIYIYININIYINV